MKWIVENLWNISNTIIAGFAFILALVQTLSERSKFSFNLHAFFCFPNSNNTDNERFQIDLQVKNEGKLPISIVNIDWELALINSPDIKSKLSPIIDPRLQNEIFHFNVDAYSNSIKQYQFNFNDLTSEIKEAFLTDKYGRIEIPVCLIITIIDVHGKKNVVKQKPLQIIRPNLNSILSQKQ